MIEYIFSIIFPLTIGIYGVLYAKKANEKAIKQRMGILNRMLGKNIKVSQNTEKFSENITFIISIIFLLIGIINLLKIVF